MRLPFFTDPYPDELLYSTCARYHRWTGNLSFRSTLLELFGNNTAIPSFNFGAAIGPLCKNIGGVYTPDKLIAEHTLFPLYRPFLPKARAEELIKQMIASDGNGLTAKIGVSAGSICEKSGITYCQRCITEDRTKYGEAYIHRVHQVQGVFICSKHDCMLRLIKVPEETSRLEYLDLERLQVEGNIAFSPDYNLKSVLKMISNAAEYLLSNNLSFAGKEEVTQRYKQLLYQKGFLTETGRVLQVVFLSNLQSFYGEKVLRYFSSGIDFNDEYSWPKVAVRNVKRTVHPIRHILLINFLDEDIRAFFDGIRRGNHFTIELKKVLKPRDNSLMEEYKANIISAIQSNPQASRTQLRCLLSKEYSYIYRRDKTWLINNLPSSPRSQETPEVVDWYRRDISYCNKLKRTFEACLAEGKRIAPTRLIRRAGIQSTMENRKEKLPKAWAYVKAVSQTVEEYQIERCMKIIHEYIEKGQPLKRWQLLRQAGLTEERFRKIKRQLKQRLIVERMESRIEWEIS